MFKTMCGFMAASVCVVSLILFLLSLSGDPFSIKAKVVVACPANSILAQMNNQTFERYRFQGGRMLVYDKAGDALVLPGECAALVSYE